AAETGGCAQWLITLFSIDIDTLGATVVEERVDRLRRRDAIPGVKCSIQIGTHPAHGLQPDLVRRTPKSCAPRCDRQLSARPYHSPQFRHLVLDVRDKENPKHTDHRVKMTIGKAQVCHVSTAELHALQPPALRLCLANAL